jgi:hypothetical protein
LTEKSSFLQHILNSWKAGLNNEVRVYQDFCDRNIVLKNREDGLKLYINGLEAREAELQKTTTELEQRFSKFTWNPDTMKFTANPEIKQEVKNYVNNPEQLRTT